MKLLRENFLLLILLALSVIAILPFLHTGFFNIHDDAQVQRVFEMKIALLDGSFPVRWVKDLGYGLGYPIFNFYGPLPYYLGAFLSILGLNVLLATKVMIAIGVIGSAFSMYFLAKEFWGKIGGLLSAILYIFAPYHALNIYVRGDIGEVYAYFFAPLIFFSLWKYYKTTKYNYILLGSLSFCGLIISHNLTAVMLSPFILITTVILFFSKRKLMIFAIPILGILLSSFYFLPVFLEMRYTNVLSTIGGKADFRDHFVCVRQLWDSPWMYGGSIPGCIDGLSFRLGKLHFIFGLAPIIFAIYFFKKNKEKSFAVFVTAIFLLVSIVLMLGQTKFIWETISFMKFFQYPWRFLLAASLFSSFLGGSVIYFISKFQTDKNKVIFYLIYALLLVSPIILYSKLFAPQFYLAKSSQDYISRYSLTWDTSKMSDEYMPPSFDKPKTANEIVKNKITGENIEVKNIVEKTNILSSTVLASKDTEINIHIPYFPAWKIYVNGKEKNFEITNSGFLLLIPKGTSNIEASFVQTNVEKGSNLLTISGILVLLAGIIYYKKKEKDEKTNG